MPPLKHEDDPRYLNLDVEVISRADLSPLADHFASSSTVLYFGPWGEARHGLILEPPVNTRRKATPERDLNQFLDLFDAIPAALQPLWKRRNLLVFDFGLEGGLWAPRPNGSINTLFIDFSPKTLARVAAIKGKLAFTLYPVHPESAPAHVE